ncbi:MAG: cobalt-precorrin-5B (C(1))-methyltransferase [Proteobacteria bacterium]|nr:cobalt-precorrin-5B (C(1))-methyltransferase [Pseudomonadota bacterium]
MSRKPEGTLRRGWTTGACATAAARGAYEALVTGRFPDTVTITLPGGERPSFALIRRQRDSDRATAGVIKDAGDDPDVTHGATIVSTVAWATAGSGIGFAAGEGVGMVTLAGLPVPPGEPAINPGPRAMLRQAIGEAAALLGGSTDVTITIAIPGGVELAKKTMNARLGIQGGLSVLGTTGVVIPYSCASWIHAIHSGIDVARAAGLTHLAGATGRSSEAAVRKLHQLPEMALIDMGDFAGGMLKYLRRHPVQHLTIAGGFGKLVKLAAGHLDLHSGASRVDLEALARDLLGLGAAPGLADRARGAASAGAVLELADQAGLPLAELVARRAREVALATLAGSTAVDVAIFDRAGRLIGHARA